MAAAKSNTEENVDFIPVAKPAMMLVAAPVEELRTMLITGPLPIAV
jgi:hypothetical protein